MVARPWAKSICIGPRSSRRAVPHGTAAGAEPGSRRGHSMDGQMDGQADGQMDAQHGLSRRTALLGAGAGLLGAATVVPGAESAVAAESIPAMKAAPLWRAAGQRGILYGSSIATWQLDSDYPEVFRRHAALLFTEDDFLWYRIKPSPDADLDFTYSDQIVKFAEDNKQLVLAAHLVWDEGFGEGWTDDDLWGISEKRARKLLFGTLREVVKRYRGRVPIWSVCNEVIVNGRDKSHHGLRTDVPWINTIGP